MTLKNDSLLSPVTYPDSRLGRKALKILGQMPLCEAMQLVTVLMTELVDLQGLDDELAVVETMGGYYRVELTRISEEEASAALDEGLERRAKRLSVVTS